MKLKEFNLLLDKLIEQEQTDTNKRLLLANEPLSKNMMTTILTSTIEHLESLRLLPLYCQGAIISEEELDFYKKVKLRKLEKEIEKTRANYENPTCSMFDTKIDLKVILANLEKDKEFMENTEWDGKDIILPKYLEEELFPSDERKIRKMFLEDIREIDGLLKFFYKELCNRGYLYIMSSKIIQSETVWNKYMYYMNFKEEFDKLRQKGIHMFSFTQTNHLKFSEAFFTLYPFVKEKFFRQVCSDPRINEFCGNENVNHIFEQERIKSQEKAIVNSDYEVYINTNLKVKEAYEKYCTQYSPYQNAEKFLDYKESEFHYLAKIYKEEILKFKRIVTEFLKTIPSNTINISSNFDFSILNKYRNFTNEYEINTIIHLGSSIKEFENKYHLSTSLLDDWYNKDDANLRDFVSLEIKKIEDEFCKLKEELIQAQQELKVIYEKIVKMDSSFHTFLFEEEDLKEIENIISSSFREKLDAPKMNSYMKFTVGEVANIEELASRYGIVFIDFILSKCFPEVRKFYYHNASLTTVELMGRAAWFQEFNQLINYNQLQSFYPKIKILDKKM